MTAYLRQPGFWLAVIIVALAVNWAYQKFFAGKGKLI
jgi:hypothetical protein